MPFTPAHPAIVLPFLRWRYVSATGLIIGTISPDFEYFFKMSVDDAHGHTLLGILYFDLPVSVLLAFVFHFFVKLNLIDNTPPFLQRRFSNLRNFDFGKYFKKHWLLFLFSAAVGAGLHIFWDSFTHLEGFFVQHIKALQDVIIPYKGARYPLWYALQYFCSYVGLIILTWYVLSMKDSDEAIVVKPSALYWLIIVLVTSVILFCRFFWLPKTLDEGNFVVSLITALCISLFIAGRFRFANNSIKI